MPGTEVLAAQPAGKQQGSFKIGHRFIESTPFWILLLCSAVYVLYAPALGFPFVYDDIFQIVQNDHLDSWHFLPIYFTQHAWSHVPGIEANFYRPLFLLWLRLNNLAFNHEPAGWHFTAILLHALAGLLVYQFALIVIRRRGPALLAAFLFLVHPVQVESVAWVSGATEPLAAVFFLGSLLCYLRWKRTYRRVWVGASLAAFACALLAKETAAVLPGIVAAYELFLSDNSAPAKESRAANLRRVVHTLLPYAFLLAVYLVVRWHVLRGFGHVAATAMPLAISLRTLPWLLCFYLRLLIWPANLSVLYDAAWVTHFRQARLMVPLLVLLCLSALVLWSGWRKQSRRLIFLASWLLLTLAPALVIFCRALPAEGFHDRYLYLPSVAFAVTAGIGFDFWLARAKPIGRRIAVACGFLAVAVLALAARHQLPYWQSNYTLFERASTIAPKNEVANLNFAAELVRNRQYQQALLVSQRAVLNNPQSGRALGSAAAAAFYMADYRQAEFYYARAVEIDPSRANLQYYLGLSRLRLGSYDSARTALELALEDDPQLRGAHYALGLIYAHFQDWQDAREEFQIELRNDPGNGAVRAALENAQSRAETQKQ